MKTKKSQALERIITRHSLKWESPGFIRGECQNKKTGEKFKQELRE